VAAMPLPLPVPQPPPPPQSAEPRQFSGVCPSNSKVPSVQWFNNRLKIEVLTNHLEKNELIRISANNT